MKGEQKKFWLSAILLSGWLFSAMMMFSYGREEEVKDKKSGEELLSPVEILTKTVESYYDLEDHGLKRAVCFVKSPEFIKSLDAGMRRIVEPVKYEAIIEPGEDIKVKARQIPPNYGLDARDSIEEYEKQLARQLTQINYLINSPIELIKFILKDPSFNLTTEADGKLTKITVARKEMPPQRRSRRGARQERSGPAESVKALPENMVIWVTKDCIVDKMELVDKQGKSILDIKSHRYQKYWTIKQLDIVKYDEEGRLDERTYLDIAHGYPQTMMLPTCIKLSLLDEAGHLIERRNEVNPVSVNFSDYEVEIKK